MKDGKYHGPTNGGNYNTRVSKLVLEMPSWAAMKATRIPIIHGCFRKLRSGSLCEGIGSWRARVGERRDGKMAANNLCWPNLFPVGRHKRTNEQTPVTLAQLVTGFCCIAGAVACEPKG